MEQLHEANSDIKCSLYSGASVRSTTFEEKSRQTEEPIEMQNPCQNEGQLGSILTRAVYPLYYGLGVLRVVVAYCEHFA
jgi:hypothetical protein